MEQDLQVKDLELVVVEKVDLLKVLEVAEVAE